MQEQLSRLLKDAAEEKAWQIETQAMEKAKELLKQAQESVNRIQNAQLQAAEAWLSSERAKRTGEVKAKLLDERLQAKHQAVQQAVEKARQRLSEIRSDPETYKKIMTGLIEETLQGIEAPVILVNPKDREMARDIVRELGLDAEVKADQSVDSGLVVKDGHRGFAVYNTLEQRLQRAKAVLLSEFNERFGL